MPESVNDKATVRSRFVNDRLTLGNYALSKASSELAHRLLQAPELRVSEPVRYLTVCAYASFGTEPDTTELIQTLTERGARVLIQPRACGHARNNAKEIRHLPVHVS